MFFGFGIFELVVLGVLFCAFFGVRKVRKTVHDLGRVHSNFQRFKAIVRNPLRFLLKQDQ